MKSSIHSLWLFLSVGVLSAMYSNDACAQVGSPCNAQRWTKGGHWTAAGCGVNDSNNAPGPLGIVRCGNSADTQSGIDDNTTYDPAEFTITPMNCENPNTKLPVAVDAPFVGQKISWFNFDVRPFAGTYDFQTIATGSYELEWALYYSKAYTCGTGANGLSGDCNSLLGLLACGTNFTGWSPQPFLAPVFNRPTNLYLVVWRKDATSSANDDFDFTFKARYGCGEFCSLFPDGQEIVTCNPDGSYSVVKNLSGTSTTVAINAPGSTSIVTNPTPLTFTSADAIPNVNNGSVTVTYPAGVNYNITMTPSGTGSYCNSITISSNAPTPPCAISGDAIVCPTALTQHCGPANQPGYSWVVSGGGIINGPANQQCVNVLASSTCNSTYTLTLTVGAGACISTCSKTVTVQDIAPPTITYCPPGAALGCNPAGLPAPGTAAATDNCGAPVISSSLGPITSTGCARSQTRTYTATDGCGNTATCAQIFTWTADAVPPSFTFCPPGSDLGCNPNGVPAAGTATATDDCSTPTITAALGPINSTGCARSQTRTYTATDGCGNTATCAQEFTWTIDTAPPTFTLCPAGGDLGCNPSGITAPSATASDNCGTPTVTSVLGPISSDGCLRFQTRTYTATDGCGNSSTCAQDFSWTEDTTPPTFTFCPAGSNLGCNPNGVPAAGVATATDACGTPTITSALGEMTSAGCTRSQTRTYTATDGCGNTATCAQVFTWTEDTTPPSFTFCPPGSDLGCNPAGLPAAGVASATDICGTPVISSALGAINSTGCTRSQTRIYTAMDGCGNTATCAQVFTWTMDTAPPTFTLCPAGDDLGCNPSGLPAPSATASDNCGTPTVTSVLGPISSNGCKRFQTRIYTATDGCGNSSTCAQDFSWTEDTTPPTFTFCPAGSNLGCNPNGVPAAGVATATDACGTPIITSALGEMTSAGCTRSQTRTYTATDGCGNTATCAQVFTWTEDTTPPTFTFCPAGSTLGCNPTGVPAAGAATATDGCGTPTIRSILGAITSDGCQRSQTRTYTATDGCGNTSTCAQVFTWTEDTTPPAFTFCPPGSNLGCNPSGVPAAGAATATDGCGTPTITSSLDAMTSNGCQRSQTRIYTATDGCGNTSTCAQVFSWTVDTAPPTFTFCPPGSNLGCNPTGVPAAEVATATDDCGTPTIASQLGAITSEACLRFQTRTYTATDGCGNSSTCSQVFSWTVDTAPPTFTFCPPGSNLGCNPTGVPAAGMATATDACGTPTITSVLGTVSATGCSRSQTRTYTAIDGCNNSATCAQVFTWTVDTAPPTFTFCPAGSNLGCNPTGVPPAEVATATDDCGTPTISSQLGAITSEACLRFQTRTYTATDGCGNSSTCSQVFSWTVDTAPPTFTFCPPGSNLGCNPTGVPAAGMAAATDACGTPTITSALGIMTIDGCQRSQTRTYRATDGCGNASTCTQVFTWTEDTTRPTFTFCPAGSNLGCNPTGVPAAEVATATDDCGTPTITSALGTVSATGCARSQTRTYTATDGCGNTATCAQDFSWAEDTTPPTFTFCPAGSNLGCNPNGVPAAGVATATDACGTPIITSALGEMTSAGCTRSQTRTYTATDGCGNTATCAQVFSWTEDTTPPTFTFCPAGSNLGCNPTGVPAAGAATATDGCGTPTIRSILGAITSDGCQRSQTRTYTATDGCGNTSTCAQVFTWTEDTTPPAFIFCPPGSNLGCNPSGVSAAEVATATDDCGTPTIISALGTVSATGCARSQIRTYTATDGCGNTATCTQDFSWTEDTTPPTFTFCPPGSNLGCNPTGVPAAGMATATDACGTPTITSALGIMTIDGCQRSQTRTYRATDGCGNASTCTQVFTWTVDTAPPTFTFCPAGSNLGCNLTGLPAAEVATATDECGTPTITSVLGTVSATGCSRSQIRTYTAIDGCNNSVTCTQGFTWTEDTTPPTFTFCPAGSSLGCNPTGVPPAEIATATDDCGTPTITSSLGAMTSNGCQRSQTRTYRATDGCGNASTCAQIFTWTVDTAPPTFTFCPVGSNLGCNPSGVPAAGAAIATDGCGTPTITSSLGAMTSNGCQRSQTRTYTATDGCGNTSTCAQVFTWTEDTTRPTFTFCPAGSNLGCNPTGVPPAEVATATDDCGTPTISSQLGAITSEACLRFQTRTYTATDGCGNSSTCSQVFSWTVDTAPPTFTFCPPGSNLGCNPTGVPAAGMATATDACGTPTITSALGIMTIDGCQRSQTRTYRATDGCGNASTCTQVFTWTVDTAPPTFTFCPAGSNLGCNLTGLPAAEVATATDECGTPTITSVLGTVSATGCSRSQIRTYTAIDGCNNSATCAQVFTWTEDTTPPTFTFSPAGSNLGCNPTGVPPAEIVTATDDCGNPTITSALGTVSATGCARSQTRTYTATDGCGNSATCAQVFRWTVDTAPPTFTFCPAGSNLGCNPSSVPAAGIAIATDDCGTPTITSALGIVTSAGCTRSQIRTYTAIDGCNNSATSTQVFTWTEDTTPPTFTFCPPGSNLGCNPTGVPPAEVATATDDCGTPTITSQLGAITSEACLRFQTRTYTATDGCGNSSTSAQVFTWTVDTAPPTFTFCPAGSNLGCNPNGVPAAGMATATDDCGTPTITSALGIITIDGCQRSQTRTYRATDGCGNASTRAQVFTWTVDTAPPTFTYCPAGSNLGCNPSGVPAAEVATATDDCGTPTISSQLGAITSEACLRFQTRTYTATDGCGNSSTRAQVFTWTVDTAPPTFTFCPAGSNLGCNPNGVPAAEVATATDDCGTPTISSQLGAITSEACLRFQTRTYTATDGCGNSSTSAQVFTWTVDTAPPTFTFCPAGSNLGCNPNGVPAAGMATATDACGTPTITSALGIITIDGCQRSQTRTYRATDGCGNASTRAQVFTWTIDTAPPTFTYCPAGSNLGCNPSGVPAAGAATATDVCGTPTITSALGAMTSDGCQRSQTRTYTATDGCGNTSTCAQVFTWTVDTAPPTFTFSPAGSNLGYNPSGVPAAVAATATDLCGTPTITSALAAMTSDGCQRSQTRIYTATDGCGNTSTCAQIFTWTVDTAPPTFTFCPAGSNLGCHPSGVPPAGVATATDVCSTPTITSALGAITSNACMRSQTRTYTATDGCGNSATCAQVFTWTEDTTPPVITCPASVNVSCSGQVPLVNIGSLNVSDNCGGGAAITHVGDATVNQTCANRYTVNRTYRAKDGCGNSSTCVQVITVNDKTVPTLTCPPNMPLTSASQVSPVDLTKVTGLSDNCGGVVTPSFVGELITNQTCANRFTLTRTFRATDICGNSATCAQVITVLDNIAPTLVMPVNLTVQCANMVPAPAPATVTASDNCNGPITVIHVSSVTSNLTCGNRFIVTRTYRATDACGNSATATQRITVFDDRKPLFGTLPPLVQTIECAAAIPPVPVVTASDNCGGVVNIQFSTSITKDPGACINNYNIIRKWVALDACGNSAVYTAKIRVVDTKPPVFTNVPANVTGDCEDVLLDHAPIPVDACGEAFITNYSEKITCAVGKLFVTRTWTAADHCQNSAQVVQQSTAIDNEPPRPMDVPADITINAGAPLPGLPNPSVWGCDLCFLVLEVGVTYQQKIFPGKVLRIWKFCDCAYNCISDTQKITILSAMPQDFATVPPPTSSVNVQTDEMQWSLIPNPAADNVNLEYTSLTNQPANIILLDMTGRVALKQDVEVVEGLNNIPLQISQLEPGVYNVLLRSGDGTGQKTFVIVR